MKRMVPKAELAAKQVGRHYDRAKPGRSVSFGNASKRIVSMLLCLCILTATLCNFGGWIASAAQATDYVTSRIADPNTMDDYLNQLLSTKWGSRYAGRIWTDKSVVAYTAGGKNTINLDMKTDGYNGEVGFNADFAHIFSALASSQVVNEWPPAPIDLVIAVDMSASMAQDTRYAVDDSNYINQPARNRSMADRIANSRIQKTLDAINETIDALMAQNKENRVSVVVYGAGATVLMPLAHYARIDGKEPYLTVGGMETLYALNDLEIDSDEGWVWTKNRDACYTIAVNALKSENDNLVFGDGSKYTNIVSNNVDNSNPKTVTGYNDGKSYTEKVAANPGYESQTAANKNSFNPAQKELKADTYVGYYTNTQGGIYLAYAQLAQTTQTTFTGTLTTGQKITVARIPAAIIMTDGGANFAFNAMDNWDKYYGIYSEDVYKGFRNDNSSLDHTDPTSTWAQDRTDFSHRLNEAGQVGDEWYNVYLPGQLGDEHKITSLYNMGVVRGDGTLVTQPEWNHAGIFYSNDGDAFGASATILQTLLTAAYMRYVTATHYETGWDAGGATKESRSDLLTYTMSVDSKNVPQWGRMRLYPSLNPKEYSLDSDNAWWKYETIFGSENIGFGAESSYNKTAVYNGLKSSWNDWKTSGTATAQTTSSQRMIIDQLPKEGYTDSRFGNIKITNQDVINNISYADDFYDIDTSEVVTKFQQILSEITGNVFTPISGSNDAGVGDSITYQDPLGEYMEIKNQSITAKTHNDSAANTYDMSLLLFGEMHGLVRAGVYDWNWNDQYMSTHGLQVGVAAFPMGWYRGDDPATAEQAKNTANDDSGSYPTQSNDGNEHYDNAAEARAAGWVFRLNYATLLQFVPITGVDTTDPSFHPSNLPDQIKNTVYTCYRFAGSQEDRNKLRRNPIFGNEIPEKVQKEWDEYCSAHSSYPDNNSIYAGTPGVYRLSDIRVWVEDTGDFIDTDGAIAPNAGYNRSLYLNVPAAAVPTQLATVTLGPDGVLSYQTNLATDKTGLTEEQKKNYSAQSTPLRLFYSVGLEDDLLLKSEDGSTQTGVDFTKISAEYIAKHTVEGQDYVWFISNYYSNTTYNEYVTDTESYRTRGDPTVTFSPSEDNRYYVFQKPLPLYAHAYRLNGDELKPVDNANAAENWSAEDNRKGGNGSTVWENATDNTKGGGSWTGGEYMGTYNDEASFKEKLANAKANGKITDDSGVTYDFHDDGIVFLERDLLDRVTSELKQQTDGTMKDEYTNDSVSFSSNDYFFILVEYYLPNENPGFDINGKEVQNSHGGRMVQHVVARRGSEFGSAFASDKIDNGDMLCWTDMNGHITKELAYLSKTDTGDMTRSEPTLEKLTLTGESLKSYLGSCGITDVDAQYNYWTKIQADENVKAALNDAVTRYDLTNISDLEETQFKEFFKFAVAARPGGIRTGDMSNNIHTKGDHIDPATGYYNDNVTKTANNYYVPTVSDNSATDNGVILNTYLGNNGYLEIANQMLHVTKMLEPPAGFELTEDQLNEEFNYQIYVQGVTGKRTAALMQYNEYAKTWERQLAYIDVLTDNSDLVLDNDSRRAVFIADSIMGSTGDTPTAKMVIANGTNEDGSPIYYVANEDGTLTFNDDGTVNVSVNRKVESSETLYYLYLPPNSSSEGLTVHSRRLYQNKKYDGTADGYVGNYDDIFSKNGTTTFFEAGQRKPTGTEEEAESRDSYRENTDLSNRPAGTRTYWAQDAELIPKNTVDEFENPSGEPETTSVNIWTHDAGKHDSEAHVALTYYNFVIRKPNNETSETNFSSPFKTRSLYLTTELEFGINANKDGDGKESGVELTKDDLYDKVIPTTDRPDLFNTKTGNDNNVQIAKNTAEFTLKHGEGLLLTGLGNRIAYRFTEKLTDKQIANGYTLKQISHIQLRGSYSIYKPGVQKIPVYTQDGATYGALYPVQIKDATTENGLTWAVDQNGKTNPDAVIQEEPFAHTNATIWESYATMAENSAGNHHQPAGVLAEEAAVFNQSEQLYKDAEKQVPLTEQVEPNPNCTAWNEETGTGCDVEQSDGSILHYMYREGKLIDPHYNGEATSYLRNMARYGVSPTVRFGVVGEDETQPTELATAPTAGYYNYSGVYSVYGNTGWFEEQANYINTVDPEMLVLTKEIHDTSDNRVDTPIDQEFEFTLELDPQEGTLSADETIYMWKGTKTVTGDTTTLTSSLTWNDADGNSHNMPTTAPALDEYQNFLSGENMLQPLEPTDGKYTVKLKANEAAVFYGMLNGQKFTFTETAVEKYPAQGDITEVSKNVTRSQKNPTEIQPTTLTQNRADFVNLLKNGTLTVEKRIKDADPDTEKEFGFTITLTPAPGTELKPEDLEATKYKADGTAYDASAFTIKWNEEGGSQKADVTLKHGEKLLIEGIPIGATYTVEESKNDGYNLQHVASNRDDDPEDPEGNYLPLTGNSVTGEITTEKAQAYLLFVNERAAFLPFVGGIGINAIVLTGILLIGLATALIVHKKCRRHRNARIGG